MIFALYWSLFVRWSFSAKWDLSRYRDMISCRVQESSAMSHPPPGIDELAGAVKDTWFSGVVVRMPAGSEIRMADLMLTIIVAGAFLFLGLYKILDPLVGRVQRAPASDGRCSKTCSVLTAWSVAQSKPWASFRQSLVLISSAYGAVRLLSSLLVLAKLGAELWLTLEITIWLTCAERHKSASHHSLRRSIEREVRYH